jgi:hypothetical protein
MSDSTYPAFPPIPRLRRGMVVTEKIDGTNALVQVSEDGVVRAGSRSRWVTPESDNYGFAKWVLDHSVELARLGPGNHYGEWWGAGIQRRYGLSEKRFSLFNTGRWLDKYGVNLAPQCCHVVPLLYAGEFDTLKINELAEDLRQSGSVAAPGFMQPEGVVVFLAAAHGLFKYTLDGDGHKGAAVAA